MSGPLIQFKIRLRGKLSNAKPMPDTQGYGSEMEGVPRGGAFAIFKTR